MALELRDIKWAVVVARHRSLRQAAETLGVRQSTVSRSLSDFEIELGVRLFERSNGGTRPTLVGQEFLDAAQRIIEETEAIIARVKARARGESGRMTIGVHASISAGNLRATLLEYRKRFPEVEIQLVDGSSDHLICDVASSAVDIAFVVGEKSSHDKRSLSVWSERIVVALPVDHPLASHDVVHWSDLKSEPLLLPQRGPGPEFVKLLVGKIGYGSPCRLLRHDVGLDRLLTLVGGGWGLLLVLEGATGATYPGVTYREVHDADGPTRLPFRAHWRETTCNPSVPPFLAILRERYPDLSGAAGPS